MYGMNANSVLLISFNPLSASPSVSCVFPSVSCVCPSAMCILLCQADIKQLKLQLEAASGDIDILLTCEWPASVTLATPPGSLPEGLQAAGDLFTCCSCCSSHLHYS